MLSNFYEAVLPDQGHYCLFLLPEAHHVWHDSIDALVDATETYTQRGGVYFGTAAFGTATSRSQANVLALKALRLDIDAGEEKHAKHGDKVYPTQRAALADCVRFFKETQLLPTYVVSSGAGLHIYYCFTEAVAPAEWLPLAKALSALGREHNLLIDPSVTEDSARVLRPVGALHHNGARVSILKDFQVRHDATALRDALGVLPPPKARQYDLSINTDMARTVISPPSSALKVAQHCQALAEVAHAKGDVPEPHWRAMLGLVKHTTESHDIAHEWSVGHDGYDAQETDRKLDAWLTGPTTCVEFGKHRNACNSCPHQGKVKSPIMLGRMTPVEVEALPPEKNPFVRPESVPTGAAWEGRVPKDFEVKLVQGVTTLVHKVMVPTEDQHGVTLEQQVEVPVTSEIFWYSHWADLSHSGDTAHITAHKWDSMTDRVKAFDIPTGALASRSDLAKKLAESGIQLSTHKRALASMDTYNKFQFQRIKDMNRRLKISDRFGLRILEDGKMVSVHGKYVIAADGTISEAMIAPGLKQTCEFYPLPIPPQFSGEWGAEVWDTHINPAAHKHAEFMRTNYGGENMGKYQLAFMLGLASPLMAFVQGGYMSGSTLPPNGLSVSLYEKEGGRGKTTLMKATMLAYGNPDELSKDQNAQGSTDLARIAKLSMWGTMPASFDEMGRTGETSVSNLISAVANGSGREGALKDGGLRASSRWSLICLVSTNRSQRDMVTVNEAESSAVQYRLLELDVNNMPDFDSDQRNLFARQWAEVSTTCAGALGAVVQRALCQMGPGAANKLVMDCVERASKMIESDKEDRFQYRALGAMMALHVILTKMGLGMFNLRELVDEFKRANENAKVYVKANALPSDELELLATLLNDLRPNTIVTEQSGHTRGRPEWRKFVPHLGAHMPNKVSARYITSQNRIYVSVEAVREWCKAKHLRDAEIVRAAKESGVLCAVYPSQLKDGVVAVLAGQYNLYQGMVESANVHVRCYAFDVHRLAKFVGPSIEEQLSAENVVPIKGERAA